MRARAIALALFICAGAVAVGARGASAVASLNDIFEAANVAASEGNYPAAIANYHLLVDAGVSDPDVYFNLGTAYAQSGDYPRAILNFERSLTLRAGDDQTEKNLHAAERALEERRAESEGEAMIQRSTSVGEAVYGELPEDALAYGLVVANFLFFCGLAWAWLTRRGGSGLYATLVVSGLVFAFCTVGLGHKAGMFRDGPRAIALDDRVSLREGPYPQAQIREEARGGDRGVVIGRDGDFVKLRLANGLEGWAPDSSVGLIDSDKGVH